MSRFVAIGVVILIVLVAIVAFSSAFTVHQTKQALILRFGEARRVITTPGLHFKAPIMDTAELIERRVLPLDSPAQEVIAADQKRLVVDAFARYRITDPLRFYQSVTTPELANQRLGGILNSAVRRVLGDASFVAIVRDDRPDLMRRITEQVNNEATKFGINIVDVRIRRADLPEANSQAVYRRMQTERQREANDIRARGEEEAQRIRARADREARVIEAEARRESEVIRGEGDAERNRLYGEAYGRDPEFFNFYRSMEAYEQALKSEDTRLVLSPNSDFFRYFRDPTGGNAPQLQSPPAAPPAGEPADEMSSAPAEPAEAASAVPAPATDSQSEGSSSTAQ